jgi:IS4 transposase
LYERVFYRLFERISGSVRSPRKFRFKHKLVSLDSTVIDLCLGASTVAAIYKDHRAVELFFKALKQNLKIKTFVGTSANS